MKGVAPPPHPKKPRVITPLPPHNGYLLQQPLSSTLKVVIVERPYCSYIVKCWLLKVPITPKYVFRLNKSLHLFETHCALLPPFNPNIDLLQAAKVMKSGHHLSHDRGSEGYRSIPCLTPHTYLHACLQRLNVMQISLWRQTRNRPMPLTSSVM